MASAAVSGVVNLRHCCSLDDLDPCTSVPKTLCLDKAFNSARICAGPNFVHAVVGAMGKVVQLIVAKSAAGFAA